MKPHAFNGCLAPLCGPNSCHELGCRRPASDPIHAQPEIVTVNLDKASEKAVDDIIHADSLEALRSILQRFAITVREGVAAEFDEGLYCRPQDHDCGACGCEETANEIRKGARS